MSAFSASVNIRGTPDVGKTRNLVSQFVRRHQRYSINSSSEKCHRNSIHTHQWSNQVTTAIRKEEWELVLPWKHSLASPAIRTASPLRRNIAIGVSSLDFPPRRNIALQPKLICEEHCSKVRIQVMLYSRRTYFRPNK